MSIDAVVLGASGYVGGEMLRLLSAHPGLRLAAAVSANNAGRPIGAVFPHLASAYGDQPFVAPDDWPATLNGGGKLALFSAAPHGAAGGLIAAALAAGDELGIEARCVDASADFRYPSASAFAEVYGSEHTAPELLADFACAVPEHADPAPSKHAGHPGCFATAALLAAVPLVKAGLAGEDLFFSGVTGSTGSGRAAKAGTHHPERHSNLYAYKALGHRHAPEIAALIRNACAREASVHFVPHSGPFARGIHMTLQTTLSGPANLDTLSELYTHFYAGQPFVHVCGDMPKLKDVVASNYARLGIATNGRAVTVLCVIDNLVKGAAGGAVQWMNRLWSLPETDGLLTAPPAWT